MRLSLLLVPPASISRAPKNSEFASPPNILFRHRTMKLAVAASFALAAPILAAYTSADIPSCANTCFEDGAPKVGCSVTDQACLCENQSDLTNEITSCVTTSCSISDALKTQQVSSGICEELSSSSSSASSTAAATSTGDSDTSTASATSSGEAASASSTAGASSFNEHGGIVASFVMMVVGVMMF
ncbi:hypothetical protein IWX90DRAFT_177308 [Phyllosticta citrichinensis]|uniref:CFEM domain-containing protein n=1 Tax=Phyllosticta citrichinensis TaxID=1130410 RepID=A0ABR1XVJ8_9PEZI